MHVHCSIMSLSLPQSSRNLSVIPEPIPLELYNTRIQNFRVCLFMGVRKVVQGHPFEFLLFVYFDGVCRNLLHNLNHGSGDAWCISCRMLAGCYDLDLCEVYL